MSFYKRTDIVNGKTFVRWYPFWKNPLTSFITVGNPLAFIEGLELVENIVSETVVTNIDGDENGI